MSWLFSRALVEAYLLDTSSGGELSARLNVTPSLQAFLSLDKMMGRSTLSRSGTTCGHLTPDRSGAVLTWCLEASRAKSTAAHLEAGASPKTSGASNSASWQMPLQGLSLPRTSHA